MSSRRRPRIVPIGPGRHWARSSGCEVLGAQFLPQWNPLPQNFKGEEVVEVGPLIERVSASAPRPGQRIPARRIAPRRRAPGAAAGGEARPLDAAQAGRTKRIFYQLPRPDTSISAVQATTSSMGCAAVTASE